MMSAMFRIAHEELRLLRRTRVAVLAMALLLLLTIVATFTAWDQRRATDAQRTRYQAQVDREFEIQPDRHPHRMVHYGHFVFRPINPLAAFDAGIDPYTGHTLFLEGHRQNSANFADIRQSSLLLRFGQLTPAFVLQVLAPLLLIFVGHSMVTREREAGTLRVLMAQGTGPGQLVAGKLCAMLSIAALALAPAAFALAWITWTTSAPGGLVLALGLGYALWLIMWAVGVVGLSALASRGRDALVILLAIWTVTVILLPRLTPELAASSVRELPTRFETDIAVARDLAAMGDSHNPNDPYFNDFRTKVLAKYGVSRVEDLPVNYKGILGMEGERLTSELFNRYSNASFAAQEAQLQYTDALAFVSPVIALRRLSMAAAGTDLHGYRSFLEQGERHRYQLIQALNRLQAEQLSYADDKSSRDSRISRDHWRGFADFRFEAETPADTLRRITAAAAVLLAWLAALAVLLVVALKRLERAVR